MIPGYKQFHQSCGVREEGLRCAHERAMHNGYIQKSSTIEIAHGKEIATGTLALRKSAPERGSVHERSQDVVRIIVAA